MSILPGSLEYYEREFGDLINAARVKCKLDENLKIKLPEWQEYCDSCENTECCVSKKVLLRLVDVCAT